MQARRRILFLAEAVTLAHLARPRALAGALEPGRYELHLAAAPRWPVVDREVFEGVHPLASIPPERFQGALARGVPAYDLPTLEAYLREDLALLERLRPDLVVGDFRLSLCVSAPLAGVPCATLANLYWSPRARRPFPVPELPLTRALGPSLGGWLFRLARPAAFALHAAPLERLRRRHGLPRLGGLLEAYTWGDHTLYADWPGLLAHAPLGPTERCLGPVQWAPSVPLPPGWEAWLEAEEPPLVYLNLGSSGAGRLLPLLLAALGGLPCRVAAATAGRPLPPHLPPNARVAEYLPGERLAARAALVVCNGGSPAAYQALAAGTPVLALPSNLDQHLMAQALEALGCARVLRPEGLGAEAFARAVEALLEEEGPWAAARRVAAELARWDAGAAFAAFVREHFGEEGEGACAPSRAGPS